MTSPDEGPEWADEAHLDKVFSTWVPGPPDSASAAEREMAGDNEPLEIPAEDTISEYDMEAALAAALAEADDAPAPAPDPPTPSDPWERTEAPDPPPRQEPRSPAWLGVPAPEAPPGPGPVPVAPPAMSPHRVDEAAPDPQPEPQPEPEPDRYAFEPVPPPPPEQPKVARPWTRSDDDILPGRRGKGRRR